MTQVEMVAGLRSFGITLTVADVERFMHDMDSIDLDTFIQLITKEPPTDMDMDMESWWWILPLPVAICLACDCCW